MATQVIVPAPPNLPLGTQEYERRFQDQYSNVLRLYFNQLRNSLNLLLGPTGGQFLNNPYAAAQRTTDKTFVANTATLVTMDQNDFLNGCSNNGTDGITVQYPGIYNYQFSVQWRNADTQSHDAWIWLRINGIDVPGTSSQFSVISKHGGIDGHVIAAANFYVQLAANDSVSLYAAVNDVNVFMDASPAQTVPFAMPAIPSLVATLSFVSSLPT